MSARSEGTMGATSMPEAKRGQRVSERSEHTIGATSMPEAKRGQR
jgi:hypothetical protein